MERLSQFDNFNVITLLLWNASNSTKATFAVQTHFASDCFVVVIILLADLMAIFKAEETALFIPFTVNLNRGFKKKKESIYLA